MKLVGVGVDIVENSRLNKLILKSKKIKKKYLYFAKRFAAKEAFVKSLGTGIGNGINFKDISIINDNLGKPSFYINEKIGKLIKKKYKTKSFNFFLSISDEKKYSIAFVIFQKK